MINKLFIHIPMIFIELVKIVSFARQGSQKIQKKKKKKKKKSARLINIIWNDCLC